MNTDLLQWWSNLRHGGMLLDMARLGSLIPSMPDPLNEFQQDRLRRELIAFQDEPSEKRGLFVAYVLDKACGFSLADCKWYRGGNVASAWSRRALTGEAIRPNHLWLGRNKATLPVFIDDERRLGVGRGKRICSRVLQWLRKGDEQLAVVTNGHQWRIVFAGLDYDAFCEWDVDQWFAEGQTSVEFAGLRALLSPDLWTPPEGAKTSPLLAAVNESRKGQADLSQVLGERVRQAAELLIQAHARVLNDRTDDLDSQNVYRAAVRMIMRLVVVLFAESREGLLPRDNPVYHSSYSLQGLRELLDRISPHRLVDSYSAYPRILALLRLIHQGSSHEAMPVPAYGGELFAPGCSDDTDGMKRALNLFETACFDADVMNDHEVRQIVSLLTRTRVKIRQGRAATWMNAPVDFSSLGSEYIGILYEGLLDFELRCAAEDEPIVFLAVGNQPSLPLTTLEQMDDKAIKNLLEKLKDTSSGDDEGEEASTDESVEPEEAGEDVESLEEAEAEDLPDEPELAEDRSADDPRYTLQARAEQWAMRACEVGSLAKKPRGRMTPEKQMQYQRAINSKARQLVVKVVLPGEWYLVRWGGTRKGSGSFYTRPQLAIPTAHRTLRPLVYDPPKDSNGQPDVHAPAESWTPKTPEDILNLKVCDPACGSGSFCLAALRFLTNALYESLIAHDCIRDHGGRAVLDLIRGEENEPRLADESLRCRPSDDEFEAQTKAILRRYIVERCIYGVDLDPLAVELCRLSLWIETLDRSLPLTFLNHKIKCGNSLVGAWFDQFLHYPAMAWNREGGDKNHTNGVHYPKEQWTKAIKEFKAESKSDLIRFIDGGQLFCPVDLTTVSTGHDDAEAALKEIHDLGIAQVDQRAEKYEVLLSNPDFCRLKDAFDLWCALWFWPADELDKTPLPTEFAGDEITDETRQIVRQVAGKQRFFHWELEFPDVFNASSHGFDAILGNPPWETLQPVSKEFFSAIDPLYRGYGDQEGRAKWPSYFEAVNGLERDWLEYNASFKAMSNWLKYAGFPFGDHVAVDNQGKKSHDLNLGDRGRRSFETSQARHRRWKQKREELPGYADVDHSFRHQGSGKAYTYKMFLEQAHALLADHGRLGLIVPSGLYSDYGTGGLRELFIDHCRWEWLFGFENREGIFAIHRSSKFNPVIVAKGGQTQAIRTAFMRRNLADWEKAEQFITEYSREQIAQFSPNSRAILEIQSQRDLEVLSKIYSNSVLLGDQSEKGWGIKYAQGDFNMTSDSKLFPPRPKWEEWGYKPDEYSRWIKGPWKPIEQLYTELGVRALPEGERRCAQPPYDTLPLPRADIPKGVILSREATHYIHENEIPEVTFTDASGKPLKIKTKDDEGNKVTIEPTGPAIALPLYEGRMIGQFDFSQKGWVSGKGRSAKWRKIPWEQHVLEPQYLIGQDVHRHGSPASALPKISLIGIVSATNRRSMIASHISILPASHVAPVFFLAESVERQCCLLAVLNSFIFDFCFRARLGAGVMYSNLSTLVEIPTPGTLAAIADLVMPLSCASAHFAKWWVKLLGASEEITLWKKLALTRHERIRVRTMIDAIVCSLYSGSSHDPTYILRECDLSLSEGHSKVDNSKGFWRVDKEKHPEHRHTVLTLVALHDLQEKIAANSGDLRKGIEAFCNQNDGEGWMLPETLRLADYGLGHDDRAKEYQPVRECFGPRFYDWQLAQSPEESWKECHLHARNLLGGASYQQLLDEIEGKTPPEDTQAKPIATDKKKTHGGKSSAPEKIEDLPLFDKGKEK